MASGPDPTTNSAGDQVGQCLNLSGLSFPICSTRERVGLDSRTTEGTLPVTFLEEDRTSESEIRERLGDTRAERGAKGRSQAVNRGAGGGEAPAAGKKARAGGFGWCHGWVGDPRALYVRWYML